MVTRLFFNRDRLTTDHRLVDRALAFDDDRIDRNLLPGADAELVSRDDLVEGNIAFVAIA